MRGEPRVGIVVGAPRSGTSLVYRALCCHPDAAWISSWVVRRPGAWWLAALDRVPRAAPAWRQRAWFPDGGRAYVYDRPRSLVDRLLPSPVEGEPVFEWCGVPESDDGLLPPTRATLAVHLRRIGRADGGAVLISKRIGHNRRIGWLEAQLEAPRWLHVVRDGRDAARSLASVPWWPTTDLWWWGGGTPADWAATGRDPQEATHRHWAAEIGAIEAGLRFVDPERQVTVRYEDLVVDPAEVLRTAAAACGLDPGAKRWLHAVAQLPMPTAPAARPAPLEARPPSTIDDALDRWGYQR